MATWVLRSQTPSMMAPGQKIHIKVPLGSLVPAALGPPSAV